MVATAKKKLMIISFSIVLTLRTSYLDVITTVVKVEACLITEAIGREPKARTCITTVSKTSRYTGTCLLHY